MQKQASSKIQYEDEKNFLSHLPPLIETPKHEINVLSVLIWEPDRRNGILEDLESDLFANFDRKDVYKAIASLHEEQFGFGAIDIEERLKKEHNTDGWKEAFNEIRSANIYASEVTAATWVTTLKEYATRRDVAAQARHIANLAYDRTASLELITSKIKQLNEAQQKHAPRPEWFVPKNPFNEHVEPLDFIADGYAAKGMITIIGAAAGAGKSILNQYIFSRHDNDCINVKPGTKVVYISGADASETELRRRARSIGLNDGLRTVETPEDMYCTMSNPRFVDELIQQAKDTQADGIIFDTAADYHQGNTYEAPAVNETMKTFRRIARETQAAIIIITHTRKGSKIKARYDVEDIADSRIWTTKSDFVFGLRSEYQDDKSNLIELQCLKSRSPQPLSPVRMLSRFDITAGRVRIEPTTQLFKDELQTQNKELQKERIVSEVHRMKADGKSYQQIADQLDIAKGTVAKYLKEPAPAGAVHDEGGLAF